jgi:hypothetical protein
MPRLAAHAGVGQVASGLQQHACPLTPRIEIAFVLARLHLSTVEPNNTQKESAGMEGIAVFLLSCSSVESPCTGVQGNPTVEQCLMPCHLPLHLVLFLLALLLHVASSCQPPCRVLSNYCCRPAFALLQLARRAKTCHAVWLFKELFTELMHCSTACSCFNAHKSLA